MPAETYFYSKPSPYSFEEFKKPYNESGQSSHHNMTGKKRTYHDDSYGDLKLKHDLSPLRPLYSTPSYNVNLIREKSSPSLEYTSFMRQPPYTSTSSPSYVYNIKPKSGINTEIDNYLSACIYDYPPKSDLSVGYNPSYGTSYRYSFPYSYYPAYSSYSSNSYPLWTSFRSSYPNYYSSSNYSSRYDYGGYPSRNYDLLDYEKSYYSEYYPTKHSYKDTVDISILITLYPLTKGVLDHVIIYINT
ncbi:unnamed protein product [Gordionus sp. m RMFG-2023]